jgi:hypothetical protein
MLTGSLPESTQNTGNKDHLHCRGELLHPEEEREHDIIGWGVRLILLG